MTDRHKKIEAAQASVADLDRRLKRADARLDAVGGRRDAAASDQYPAKITIECSATDFVRPLLEFLRYVKSAAGIGHSFSLEADREEGDFHRNGGWPRISIDGDGADQIGRILLNGEDVTKGEIPWKIG